MHDYNGLIREDEFIPRGLSRENRIHEYGWEKMVRSIFERDQAGEDDFW